MSGKVIRALRASPLQRWLSEAELTALSNCGRVLEYEAGQLILTGRDADARLFVLQQGRVMIHLSMWTNGGHCGGETQGEVSSAGVPFGWGAWVKPERIAISAYVQDRVSVIALDLTRLKDGATFLKLSQHMVMELYQWLQQSGLCPPNLQALVQPGQPLPV